MTMLKTINYRGGVAQFQIPSSWVEEYAPQGGGTFYPTGDDTGTLRINVMDFERSADEVASRQSAYDFLAGMQSVRDVERLPSGNAIARSAGPVVDQGEDLAIYTWQIGVCVTPAHFRIVVFTYTILAAQEHERAMQQELELIDRIITEGEYPAVRGLAGNYIHDP